MIYQVFAYRERFKCEPKSLNDIFEFLAYTKTEIKLEEMHNALKGMY